MHSFIVAMARRFPIQLGIIVGRPAMIATAPVSVKTIETGMVIASTDAVAADTVGAQLPGFQPQGVRHIWEAGKLGLGETDISQLQFKGLDQQQAIEEFNGRVYGQTLTFELA